MSVTAHIRNRLVGALGTGWLALVPAAAQTVIINEVSNGPAGVQEYIEFVVAPTAPTQPCEPLPCLDLRGWIFDDNNGYHGSGGAATGAMRFSQHALWSCVPVGTIVVVYNSNDPNPSLPMQDVSLTDGNCSIVVGVGANGYFEQTGTTPVAALCSNPGGWSPGGDWTRIGLRNEGDCARICEPSGCEVFSFCYGNVSANATVHIAGGGAQRVWSFQGGDPYDQGEWTFGSVNNGLQTPGAPNSPVNAAWIAPFNNNCTPSNTALVVTADAMAGCGCTSSASASATGAAGPYTYDWRDAAWVTIGQDQAQATGLCAGTYHVIVTSGSGCSDTATVAITALPGPDAGDDGALTLCTDAGASHLFDALGGTPDVNGSWSPATVGGDGFFDPTLDAPGAYTYTVPGGNGCPAASAVVTVAIRALPQIDGSITHPLCADDPTGAIDLDITGTGPFTIVWDDGAVTEDRIDLAAGVYTVAVTDDLQCASSGTFTLVDPALLEVSTGATPSTCGLANGSVCASVIGGTGTMDIQWNTPAPTTAGCAAAAVGTWTVTVTDANGCNAMAQATVEDAGQPTDITVVTTDVSCLGSGDGSITVELHPEPPQPLEWSLPDGGTAFGLVLTDLDAGTYEGQTLDASGCPLEVQAVVGTPDLLVVQGTVTAESCAGLCDGSVSLVVTGGVPGHVLSHGGSVFQGPVLPGLCAGPQVVAVEDANGCQADLAFTVQGGASVSVAQVDPVAPVCVDASPFNLGASPAGGLWSGPGIMDAAIGLFDPSMAGAGMHTVHYQLPGGCAAPAEASVEVMALPSALFTVSQVGGADDLHFTAGIQPGVQYAWYMDGRPVGAGPVWHVALGDDRGSHEICLEVSTGAGCADAFCRVVEVVRDQEVHVPNAFTPDVDGINDLFAPTVLGAWPAEARFIVFDRWGKELFNTATPEGWDGRSHGTDVPMGVYPWRFSYRQSFTGDLRIVQGHVTLLR